MLNLTPTIAIYKQEFEILTIQGQTYVKVDEEEYLEMSEWLKQQGFLQAFSEESDAEHSN